MQQGSMAARPGGLVDDSRLEPSPVEHFTEEQHKMLAKSLSAMLCARTGISHGDPLLGNSRSGSPYTKPRDASTTSAGSLDTACMQLPPPAFAILNSSSSGLVGPSSSHLRPLRVLQQHCPCPDSQCCSHGSGNMAGADNNTPAHATPLHPFKTSRLGSSGCYGSPSTHSHDSAAALPPPAFTVEEPACIGHAAAVTAVQKQQQQQEEDDLEASAAAAAAAADDAAADDAAACHDNIEIEPPAVLQPQRRQQQHQEQQQQRQQQPLREAPRPSCVLNSPKAWLYELVTCPFLFKPCPQCSATNGGREVLITYFDTDNPSHGFCTYCPQRHSRPHLLQIRRSTYHEVVKASDVSRLTDVSGIQHYVINGAKVLFLRPRPQPRPPKGVVAPSRCAVDGRQLMDAHSSYCSLRCKLEVEDVVFAANFPSAAEELQAASAAGGAADGNTAGLAGSYHKQGGHEGRRVVVPGHKRPAAAMVQQLQPGQASAGTHSHDDMMMYSSEDGADAADGGGWGARHKRHRHMPSKFANAVVGGSYAAAVAGGFGGGGRHGNGAHRAGQHSASRAGNKDDTASDQGVMPPYGGTPLSGATGVAGLHLLHKGGAAAAAAEAGSRRASPCGSDDSGRSTTCTQRAHKRKGAPPCRSALQ